MISVLEAGVVTLRRIVPAQNMRRYEGFRDKYTCARDVGAERWADYRMDVQPDLFGQWSLFREFGRIGSPGRVRIAPYPTQAAAIAALAAQRQAKERRGYAIPR